MQLGELRKMLNKIVKCHPEANEAEVWAVRGKQSIHVKNIGYDKKHKPARIKLEE